MAWCFSTRASVATVLTTHPCVFLCLRVNMFYSIHRDLCTQFALCRLCQLFTCFTLILQNYFSTTYDEPTFEWDRIIRVFLLIFPWLQEILYLTTCHMLENIPLQLYTYHNFGPTLNVKEVIGVGRNMTNLPPLPYIMGHDVRHTDRFK